MEGVRCDLDVDFAHQIEPLLSPPPPDAVKEYYDDVIKRREPCAIEVKQNGKVGKGVYATKEYKEEELILRDKMLVAAQHCANKIDCLVCSYCFSYIGSIELQIGRKLYLRSLKSISYLTDGGTISDVSDDVCPVDLMESEENPLPRSCIKMNSSSPKDLTFNNSCVNEKDLVSLMDGSLTLPHSYQFPLPSVISCPGGCEEEHYCSDLCAKKDWETCHSLLCTGERSESPAIEALVKFMEHANRTNDIFILTAKAISYTILKYRRLKRIHLKGKEPMNGSSGKDTSSFPLLLEAWRPISMGFQKRWWDCVALPDDVDHLNEGSFRMQIKQLAFESLQLLKEAIFDKECAPLFSLEIYGHIIGMFELNNLDLVVASPVEDYFLYVDDLPPPEKEKAEMLTGQFLDALGDSYSDCCEGTAFFPLQSCMNHSCSPNAKAFKRDEDRDGHAIILALKPISKGEEITISYIDEDLTYKERQALLADYGFTCRCSKCLEEEKEE